LKPIPLLSDQFLDEFEFFQIHASIDSFWVST